MREAPNEFAARQGLFERSVALDELGKRGLPKRNGVLFRCLTGLHSWHLSALHVNQTICLLVRFAEVLALEDLRR